MRVLVYTLTDKCALSFGNKKSCLDFLKLFKYPPRVVNLLKIIRKASRADDI